MAIALTARKLVPFLTPYIEQGLPVLIKGAPGLGKTSVIHKVADVLGYDRVVSHPAVEEPINQMGMPWLGGGDDYARFIPFDQLHQILNATRPTIWFLDDFGQGSEAVQKGYMQWLLGRQLGGHRLPDCVSIVAATNGRNHRAGVSGVLEPVKGRFTIVEMVADVESWSDWAIDNLDEDVAIRAIGFFKRFGDLLSKFEPKQDIENSPNPRNWSEVFSGPALKFDDDELVLAGVAGRVGEGAAATYIAFHKMSERMPDPEAIIKSPATAPIPTEIDVQYALSVALSQRTSTKTAAPLFQYVQRLHEAGYGDIAAMTAMDMRKKDKRIESTPAWTAFSTSPLGQTIFSAYRI